MTETQRLGIKLLAYHAHQLLTERDPLIRITLTSDMLLIRAQYNLIGV